MENNFKAQIKALTRMLMAFFALIVVLIGGLFYLRENPDTFLKKVQETKIAPLENVETDFDKIENGIHVATGFVEDDHMQLVIQNCTSCHSAKLVTQNRMSEAGWKATITWMQETQNLWDLGPNEEKIVAYLSKNYAPKNQGRRANISVEEWYELE